MTTTKELTTFALACGAPDPKSYVETALTDWVEDFDVEAITDAFIEEIVDALVEEDPDFEGTHLARNGELIGPVDIDRAVATQVLYIAVARVDFWGIARAHEKKED